MDRLSKHILDTAHAPIVPPPTTVEECNETWVSWIEHEVIEIEALEERLEAAEKYRASLDEWAEMAYLYLGDRRGKGERMMMKQLEHIHLRFAALAGEE